ncbi:MAG: hypothetical protein Q8R76_01845 [Candidatus Omnitrophota bacterium]|nr:hypothetical protein [Candidatus Omnitrophota bacterium]
MSGFLKIIGWIIPLTVGLLLYVHGQVSLFQVSYSLDLQRHIVAEKREEYRRLKFEVDQLKAPRVLERRIKDEGLELALPDQIRVLRVSPPVNIPLPPVVRIQPKAFSDGLTNFLGKWVRVAQAKPDA